MAGFQLSINGRFWVSTEDPVRRLRWFQRKSGGWRSGLALQSRTCAELDRFMRPLRRMFTGRNFREQPEYLLGR